MHQEMNKSRHQKGLCMRVPAVKQQCECFLEKFTSWLSLLIWVNERTSSPQCTDLTGLRFVNDRFDSWFLKFSLNFAFHHDISNNRLQLNDNN